MSLQRPGGSRTDASLTAWPTLCGACSAAGMSPIRYPCSPTPTRTSSAWPSRPSMATCAGSGNGQRFSIQSISKVFTLALVIAGDGAALWTRVGREPSGTPFNSLVQLEYEHGIPRNPFINAGALVVTDRLLSLTGDACGATEQFLRTECGCPEITSDAAVASSEAGRGDRNAALAHFLASYETWKTRSAACLTT